MDLSPSDYQKLKALKTSFPYFARNCLKIKTKDSRIIPFEFNRSQQYFHDICEEELKRKGRVRIVVVKGRQSGISTYVEGRYYHKTSTTRAINTFILSHESSTTDKLFSMAKMYNERNPYAPDTKRSNAKELAFSALDSQYYIGTAGSGDVGRGGTVQLFHGSEVAFWKNTDEIETGLMESIPEMDGTEIILESTANGIGNYFYRMAMGALKGENGYRLVFIPWFWMEEYEEEPAPDFSLTEQEEEYARIYLKEYDRERIIRKIAWRRTKISRYGSEWKFKQEYPSHVTEAFQTSSESLIKADRVVEARKRQSFINNDAPLVMGVDPARNKDRAVIAFRRGRELERFISFEETGDDMWFADKIASFIDTYGPITCNIDCSNSWAIHDYLKRKGYDCVRGFHFGQKATEDRTYVNLRAEIWCKLRDWLNEEVKIPDSDELHADLTCVPEYDETDGKIRLAKKEDIKKEVGFSPDIGDAVALTFAVRISQSFKNVTNKTPGMVSVKNFKSRGSNRRLS